MAQCGSYKVTLGLVVNENLMRRESAPLKKPVYGEVASAINLTLASTPTVWMNFFLPSGKTSDSLSKVVTTD